MQSYFSTVPTFEPKLRPWSQVEVGEISAVEFFNVTTDFLGTPVQIPMLKLTTCKTKDGRAFCTDGIVRRVPDDQLVIPHDHHS